MERLRQGELSHADEDYGKLKPEIGQSYTPLTVADMAHVFRARMVVY